MTRDNCVCWDYETPDAECHCAGSEHSASVTTEYMSTDIGPACAKCGDTLYHYRVTAGDCYSDVRAICATCHKINWFDANSRLDHVQDVRRRHIQLNDDGRLS